MVQGAKCGRRPDEKLFHFLGSLLTKTVYNQQTFEFTA